jgi:hypothetical protein
LTGGVNRYDGEQDDAHSRRRGRKYFLVIRVRTHLSSGKIHLARQETHAVPIGESTQIRFAAGL